MTLQAPASQDRASYPWLANYPPGVDWNMEIPVAPLYSLLDDAARRYPNNPALTFIGKTTTYAALAAEVDRTAAGLQRIGVRKGAKVGLFLPNTPTFFVYYFAILKAGGVVVNFNPLYTIEELTFQVKDSETEMMVTHDLAALFGKVEELVARDILKRAVVVPFTPLLPAVKALLFKVVKRKELADLAHSRIKDRIVDGAAVAEAEGPPAPVAIDPLEDVAVLQYTGGTTGTPKGAMLTHANLYTNTVQIKSWAADLVEGKESMLGALPLFHVFAMTAVMNFGVAKAARMILMPRFQLDEALKLIHPRSRR